MLSPSLLTQMVSDGFRLPAPAGASFTAGDVVPVGADLVGIAANDSNWSGNPNDGSSLNAVGVYDVPKASPEVIDAGVPLGWNMPQNQATAVAAIGEQVQYPLGISLAAAGNGATTVRTLVWPGTGLGTVPTTFTSQDNYAVVDPGTGANVVVTAGGLCALTIAAAGETRGLPAPTFAGQRMTVTIGGFTTSATVKVALGAAYNATPATTVDGANKFATMNAFGQGLTLEAIPLTASTFVWKLLANLGSTLSAS